jgi:hypothetical protein
MARHSHYEGVLCKDLASPPKDQREFEQWDVAFGHPLGDRSGALRDVPNRQDNATILASA